MNQIASDRDLAQLSDLGVTVSSPNDGISGSGNSSILLESLRTAGGRLPISKGEVTTQDIANLSQISGNEIAIFRDRASGQMYLSELGPAMGEIPLNSRLIIHLQPGEGALAVQPSSSDRSALVQLGQRSSVIINSDGTYSIRFRATNSGDGPITPIGR